MNNIYIPKTKIDSDYIYKTTLSEYSITGETDKNYIVTAEYLKQVFMIDSVKSNAIFYGKVIQELQHNIENANQLEINDYKKLVVVCKAMFGIIKVYKAHKDTKQFDDLVYKIVELLAEKTEVVINQNVRKYVNLAKLNLQEYEMLKRVKTNCDSIVEKDDLITK